MVIKTRLTTKKTRLGTTTPKKNLMSKKVGSRTWIGTKSTKQITRKKHTMYLYRNKSKTVKVTSKKKSNYRKRFSLMQKVAKTVVRT